MTKPGEACFSIWYLLMHRSWYAMQQKFGWVNLFGRSWRTWRRNHITPTYPRCALEIKRQMRHISLGIVFIHLVGEGVRRKLVIYYIPSESWHEDKSMKCSRIHEWVEGKRQINFGMQRFFILRLGHKLFSNFRVWDFFPQKKIASSECLESGADFFYI